MTCTRAGRRHAEPDANVFGTRIHFSHDFDLTVALWNICLIHADSVDPNIAGLMLVTQIAKGVVQIDRDEKVFMGTNYEWHQYRLQAP